MKILWGRDKEAQSPQPAQPQRAATPQTAGGARPSPDAQGRRPQKSAAAPSAAPKQLAELLLEQGAVTEGQLEEAIKIQRESGGFLGQILVDLKYIDENSLVSFLAKHCKIPHLSLLDYLIEKDLLQLVPKDVCLKYRLLPIDKLGKNLTIAMVNPLNQEALAKVQELNPDLRIKPILCAYSHYQRVIEKVFGEKDDKAQEPREMTLEALGLSAKASRQTKSEASKRETEAAGPASPSEAPLAAPVIAEAEQQDEAILVTPVEEEESLDGDTVLTAFMGDGEESAERVTSVVESAGRNDDSSVMMAEVLDVMRDSMRDTYDVLARRMKLFRGLRPEDVAKIFATGITSEYDAGETIFTKGDRSDELYVVLSGKVEVRDGERLLATLGPGGLVGEIAWISDEPRSATVTAVEPTSLITLNNEIFDNLIAKDAAIQLLMNIILLMSERLRAANRDEVYREG